MWEYLRDRIHKDQEVPYEIFVFGHLILEKIELVIKEFSRLNYDATHIQRAMQQVGFSLEAAFKISNNKCSLAYSKFLLQIVNAPQKDAEQALELVSLLDSREKPKENLVSLINFIRYARDLYGLLRHRIDGMSSDHVMKFLQLAYNKPKWIGKAVEVTSGDWIG